MGERVFVGACNGLFLAVNRYTGTIEWQYDIRKDGDQTGFHGRFLSTNDLVIVATDGNDEGFVYAFEQASGRVRWKHHVGSPVPSDVVRKGQLIYVHTMDDSLLALNIATGIDFWRFGPTRSPRVSTFVSSPIIASDYVVVTGRDGVVYALDAGKGQIAWHYKIGAELTSPVLTQELIYIGIAAKDSIINLSVTSGSRVAQMQSAGSIISYMPPVVSDWGVFVVTGKTLELWTTDLMQRRWQANSPANWSRSPVLWNDKIIGGTVRGYLLGYQATDGHLALSLELSGVVTGLVGYDDVLYVGTQEGILYAVRP